MNITYISVIEEIHNLRFKYLSHLFNDLREKEDELVVVNKVGDYRMLENIKVSDEPFIKTIDLFNIEDDFKTKMVGCTHASNEFICFISPLSYFNKKAIAKAKSKLEDREFSGFVYTNGYILNPINGLYYRALNRSNISVGSLIFNKSYLAKIINYNGSANSSLCSAIRDDGQLFIGENKTDYMEFTYYDNIEVSEEVSSIDDKVEKKDKKALLNTIKYLKKTLIN
jgi:hypothetical protein